MDSPSSTTMKFYFVWMGLDDFVINRVLPNNRVLLRGKMWYNRRAKGKSYQSSKVKFVEEYPRYRAKKISVVVSAQLIEAEFAYPSRPLDHIKREPTSIFLAHYFIVETNPTDGNPTFVHKMSQFLVTKLLHASVLNNERYPSLVSSAYLHSHDSSLLDKRIEIKYSKSAYK